MRTVAVLLVLVSFSSSISACPWCRIAVRDGIYNRDFLGNLLLLILPVLIMAAGGVSIYHFEKILSRWKRMR